jgi:DNA-binding beta-propeller fold protein YncE
MSAVSGRIDHLAVDDTHQIVYVAALGNNTVEVIDLAAGKVVHSIKGVHEPQGLEYLPSSHTIFVANGGTGVCNFFDAATFQVQASLNYGDDADDVRYLNNNKTVYVGYASGGIGIISEESKSEIGRIEFSGHPEGFQVDPKTKKIWVNVPDDHKIAVLDGKNLKVIDQWKINNLSSNFPMAYDSIHHRLFVGFRSPAKMVVFDSETGKQIASLPCVGDTDDLFYDADSKRILVSGGSGYIDIFSQDNQDSYSAIAHITSRKGARTSLWIPSTHEFILAVPRSNTESAELRVYKMND